VLPTPAPQLSRRGFLAALGVLTLPGRAVAGENPSRLQAALTSAERWAATGGGRFGASFVDLTTGLDLGSVSADVADNPASNQKLVTAGAALSLLGPAHVFTTTLHGRVEQGRVAVLVISGDGDPSLTSADLVLFAGELRKLGVTQVGDIVVDQSAFDDKLVPPGFEQQPEEWAAFRAPVSAVAVDRNSVLVGIVPGSAGSPARVEFEPSGFVDVEGEITSVKKGVKAVPRVGLVPRGQRLGARLGGAIGENDPPLRYRQRVDDPRLFAGYSLRSALAAVGIGVGGTVRSGAGGDRRELLVHRSRPLAELLPELGKASDNFYAEMLFRALGKKARGRPATSAAGAATATAWLKEIGAWDEGVRITNGSGLFDSNRLSPRSLSRLLSHVAADPLISREFLAQLAVAGVDGTLKGRFKPFAKQRSILGKTGTLKDVVALSGYVLDGDKPKVAFAAIMSGVAGRTAGARDRIDRMVGMVADDVRKQARAPIS